MPCRLLNVARLACSVAPVWAWLLLVGCNSSPVEAPALSASSASEAAISQFDKNGNQSLDAAELAQAPGLLSMLKKADTDSDAALSQA